MDVIAVIPARGKSKGILRKNLQWVGGKPLIGHAIAAAVQAPSVTRVVVSTDDPEIAAVAFGFGAEVVERPEQLSGDAASSEAAILHTLETLRNTSAYQPDWIVFLQCTSPLTLPEHVEGIVQHCMREQADTALSVVANHGFLWKEGTEGNFVGVNHDLNKRQMRQALSPEYRENGALYCMRANKFVEQRHRFFGKTVVYEMEAIHGFEIDETVDLTFVEMLMAQRQKTERIAKLPAKIAGIIFDFDGVFTDNTVILNQEGQESVRCSRGDGLMISRFKEVFNGRLLVLSAEENPVVLRRCEKLKLDCIHGAKDKFSLLQQWVANHAVELGELIYLGNDLNDVACLQAVGCGVVVADADQGAVNAADLVLTQKGGQGAVRELLALIIERDYTDKLCNI